MSLFAIADTHLSFGTNKPMDTFSGWENYTEKLKNNWNKIVTDRDTVVIAGDISWAMDFEELEADFRFLESLNGSKIILKGNHDYWWNTMAKMNKFLAEKGFETIKFLHNNSFDCGGASVCGSRGWLFESEEEHDEKVLNRELIRIRASLDSAQCKEKLVFLHYPPLTMNTQCEEIISILNEYGIKKCFFGHLHGEAAKYAVDGERYGINFKLISCDRLNFIPYLISKY